MISDVASLPVKKKVQVRVLRGLRVLTANKHPYSSSFSILCEDWGISMALHALRKEELRP